METIRPDKAPSGAILVIHSWWGLTESFRTYGAHLADAGYVVGLADLFDGKTAKTEAEARKLRAMPRRTPMYKTLGADLETLRNQAGRETIRAGIVGFSMGGHWAVWLSQRPEYDVKATILYYAARGGDFSNCRASMRAHFAAHDPWVSASARRGMEKAIGKSGSDYSAYDYPDTRHWFAETDRPTEYDAASAKLALERDLRFFKQTLDS